MAGTAAARALTADRAPAASPGRFEVSLATPADDAAIRRLLRDHPLPGDVAISLEREPDSRVAAGIQGDVHQTLVAKERATGRVAATASRSVLDAFVNGRPTRLGYLGQLRVAPPFRRARGLLEAGYVFCRGLHDSGDARVYLTSIVAGNDRARRLLVGAPAPSSPRFEQVGCLTTLLVPRRRFMGPDRRDGSGADIHAGSDDLLGAIADCLWRNGQRHQFAPCWRPDHITSDSRTPGLRSGDFVVSIRGSRVVGCVACWDQRPFKQVVVRGYSARLARWRPFINAVGPWVGVPRLPDAGRRVEVVSFSHLAVDGDDPAVASALVAAAGRRLPADAEYAAIGVPDGSPFLPVFSRRFRGRSYRSLLFLACWADGDATLRSLDNRLPGPEVAIL